MQSGPGAGWTRKGFGEVFYVPCCLYLVPTCFVDVFVGSGLVGTANPTVHAEWTAAVCDSLVLRQFLGCERSEDHWLLYHRALLKKLRSLSSLLLDWCR